MESGRQIAERNWGTFNAWLASKSDNDFRQMIFRGVLSRKEIAMECGFSKSALDQNPRIKAALTGVERDLRERGVLPPLTQQGSCERMAPRMRETGKQKAVLDAERMRRLEHENASLRAENSDLKRRLEKYVVLHEALSLTGRVPR